MRAPVDPLITGVKMCSFRVGGLPNLGVGAENGQKCSWIKKGVLVFTHPLLLPQHQDLEEVGGGAGGPEVAEGDCPPVRGPRAEEKHRSLQQEVI